MGFLDRLLKSGLGGHGGGGYHGGGRSREGGHGGHGSHGGHGDGYYPPAQNVPPQPATAASSGLICAKCGTPGASGARFCSGCGGQLVAAACPGCGTPFAPGARFCNQCGRPAP